MSGVARDHARPPSSAPSAARAYVGLAVLGLGLTILLGVSPHEDLWVGASLAVFGAALFVTSPGKPRPVRIPRLLVGAVGILAASSVLAYDALTGSPLNVTKTAILTLGLGLAAAAPFLHRSLRVPGSGKRFTIASAVECLLIILIAPLALWGIQALAAPLMETTPTEQFIHFGLLLPISAIVTLFGWEPTIAGQILHYSTPHGPIAAEVGAACSGLGAMGLFSGVLALFVVLERPRGGRLAVWTTIGLLGVYVANLARLTFLVAVGYAWGPAALIQAHAQAGWVFFVAWAVLFAAMTRARRPQQPPHDSSTPKMPLPAIEKGGVFRAETGL